jgi:hypothetical protein
MRTLGIASIEELRQADHRAVIAWERHLREIEHAAASIPGRRMYATLIRDTAIDDGLQATPPVSRDLVRRMAGISSAGDPAARPLGVERGQRREPPADRQVSASWPETRLVRALTTPKLMMKDVTATVEASWKVSLPISGTSVRSSPTHAANEGVDHRSDGGGLVRLRAPIVFGTTRPGRSLSTAFRSRASGSSK